MPPLPGDPHPSRQSDFDAIGVDDTRDPDEDDNHPFSIILQMNEFTEGDKRVKDAVLYCKSQADFLKASDHPLYVGSANGKGIDPQVWKVSLRLNRFLDKLITLSSIRSEALYSKLRILLAQGESYETFKTASMSLCASCFQAANHEGHDFTRFFSREGGACDCGNSDVIRPMGCECVNYGGPMREAMAEILMDKDLYSALTERNSDDVELAFSSDISLDWRTRLKFHDDRMSLFSEKLRSFFPHLQPDKLLK
ncbi:hypothetical protein TELCIR_09404 [Teladorsagia circumcincta]|uniref:E3 ubiquitin-protein ligase n=1 Tax=Teladorsagia circumcincta TaxID=45464 RepID=A0A2G9UGD8_TELCI|nr:hypothetical protein TELCIR_09404 [Teladorsagia circumcincta]